MHVQMTTAARTGRTQGRWRWGRVVVAAAGVAVALAACSSTSSSTKPAATTSATPSSTAATLETASSSYGTILVTPSGQVLYALTADTATHDACAGACLAIWPPLTVASRPVAGSGVTRSSLSTLKLSDGKLQVVYAGHPLYIFGGDRSAGQTKGQGLAFPAGSSHPKGHWWLVSASGSYVTKASPSSSSSSSSSGYGNSGY
jgi:predicted lipoprotein with Yx(FWY)xxD motif